MSKQLTTIARGIIMVFALLHLIFTNIHVRALLLLEHQLCGFVMFMFVLTGLLALFEATRIKMMEIRERVVTAAICMLSAGLGLYLISIYRSAIRWQRSLDGSAVYQAVIFSTMMVGAYVLAACLLMIDLRKRG